MDLNLEGKVALVTGSTAGIGYATAEALAREGAHVVVNGRDEQRTRAAAERMAAENDGAHINAAAGDLSTAEGAEELIEDVGDIDILVNNVGYFEPRPFFEIEDAEWTRMFEVNVMSGVRLARYYLPRMMKRGWGRIIFVSSESGAYMPAEMIHYGFSKTAQLAIARGLAELTAGSQVTVNSVLPGPTMTEGVSAYLDDLAASQSMTREQAIASFFANNRPTSLIRRFAEPHEVADVIAYVASPRAALTNGAPVRAEGGIIRSYV